MNEEQAKRIIKDTFETSFNEGKFIYFIMNLLNLKQSDIKNTSFGIRQGYNIPEIFRPYISRFQRIAKYLKDNNRIDVLIVYLRKETSIECARSRQRNFIAGYLKGNYGSDKSKDAALVAFVSPNEMDWRFSMVKMDYRFEEGESGKIKVREKFTPARRWSFLVGKNESSHTAQSRLVRILSDDQYNPTLIQLEEAFNIEKVTKEFFLKYRNLFLRTKEKLDKVVENDPKVKKDFEERGVNTVNFAKKLLGQIIFLYFLQKKGWFGVERNGEGGTGQKDFLRRLFNKEYGNYKNFFNDILEPLFYEALARERDDDFYSRFNCKIPFLNGGLFEPIGSYDWVHTDINLSNELFSNRNNNYEGNGVLDIFDLFNFTVKEDEPLEKEVAIDPELLGKIYEKFNAIRPDNYEEYKKVLKSGRKGEENKFNKKFGVYYTPREIVHYMCQQSLINYLEAVLSTDKRLIIRESAVQKKLFGFQSSVQQTFASYSYILPKEDIEKLIYFGDQVSENEAVALIKEQNINEGKQKSSKTKLQLPESIRKNAKLIDDKLAEITVCDPAVGSGAFPVGMMAEIVKTRNVLLAYIKEQNRTPYNFKRECIKKSLYGVDIDPGAVEIAKLRLWLSLIVDEEDIKRIKPLPNLDYKIMQGNSLISEFLGINFDIEDEPSGTLKFKDKINFLTEQFQEKKNEFLSEPDRSKKEHLKQEIESLIIKIFEEKLKKQKSDYFSHLKFIEEKYSILPNEKQRNEIIAEEKEKFYKKTGFNLEQVEKQLKEYTSGRKIRSFFPWKLYFAEVFQGKCGFDVVIANPPYVRQEKIRDQKPLLQKQGYEIYNSTSDLYTYFYERSYQILKPNGFSCFISSNKWMRAKYGEKLRKFFKEKTKVANLIDFGGYEVFEATVDTNILLFQKNKSTPNHTFNVMNIQSDFTKDTELNVYSKKHSLSITQEEIDSRCFTFVDHVTMKLKAKIEDRGVPLKDWDIKICFGIKTGFSEAFIINNETKEKLFKQDSKITEILKPILRGRDINKWHYKWAGLWLINSHNGLRSKGVKRINVEKDYPIIYKHLQQYQENLEIRQDKGDNWTNLRNCAYLDEFEKEKILYQEMSYESSFSWDNNKMFVNQSCYIISNANKYILSLLNSKLINDYFRLISQTLGTGAFRWIKQYVEQIPIPKISSTEQKPFIELVDRILTITKDKGYLENTKMQAKAKEYEYQIDQMVYKLYNLTPEEIEIAESFNK